MRRTLPALLAPIVLASVACEGSVPVSLEGGSETAPAVEETTIGPAQDVESPEESTDPPGEQTPPDPENEPKRQSTEEFGEPIAFPYHIGAYEEEFTDETADVVYTVDEVSRTTADRVDFTLFVEVPELGRTFGFSTMEVVCEAGPEIPTAQTDEPLAEVGKGTHSSAMWCEVPVSVERVRVVMMHGDDEAAWAGPV